MRSACWVVGPSLRSPREVGQTGSGGGDVRPRAGRFGGVDWDGGAIWLLCRCDGVG